MRLRIMFRTKNKMKVSHLEEKRWKAVGCSRMIKSISKKKNGTSRSLMHKNLKTVRCASLNGSAWSTERKHMKRYKGIFDIFFGIEHRMKKEESEKQFNKEAKQGWRFAADAARIIGESAGSEDRKHTSEGVFMAVDNNLGAVVSKEEGAVASVPGKEGILAEAWVNVRGGMRVCRLLSALGRMDSEK